MAAAATMLVHLQVSALEQLKQLELLASTGFSEPDRNSNSPDQVPSSSARASADGHAHGSGQTTSQPSLQPDSSQQQLVHDVQQDSSGGEQGQGEEGPGGCAEDIHVVGRLMVQLFRGRMLHHGATDHRQVTTHMYIKPRNGTCAWTQARRVGKAVALAMQRG